MIGRKVIAVATLTTIREAIHHAESPAERAQLIEDALEVERAWRWGARLVAMFERGQARRQARRERIRERLASLRGN